LAKNQTLKSLDMGGNLICDSGAVAIASSLRINNILTKLELNGNSVGSVGAVALAEMLTVNTSLVELALGKNRIGNEGVISLASALESNTALARLDLHGNTFNDVRARALFKSLNERNTTLMALDLEDNGAFPQSLLEAVNDLLASRRALKVGLNHLRHPLKKQVLSYAFQAVNTGNLCHGEKKPSDSAKARGNAGFIYHVCQLLP
jgi:Leucine-rich repeat (LRR) protein